MTFEELKITRQFINALEEIDVTEPTRIQRKAIPSILSGQDVVGIAPTGTGKTFAFLLPALMKLKYAQGEVPRAVILAPTKELVIQIAEVAVALAKYTDLRILALYGGIGKKTQVEEIQKGVDLVVTTPGRLLDIYLDGNLNLRKINVFVLDEADRMMDMGFIHQIRKILEVVPVKRQNLLFSATFPQRVEELSHEFLEFPTRVEAAPQSSTVKQIEQRMYRVPNFRTKLYLLEHFLKTDTDFNRVLVFCRTKDTAENIYRYFVRHPQGEVRVIHSNKGQNSRINAMELFKAGELRMVIATDVASRGIDVSDVSHVINFEVPRNYEDYVHRIGRTGRASASGIAITFVNKAEMYHIKKIEQLIRETIPLAFIPEEITEGQPLPGEMKEIAREIDDQKRREDPTFQGAFHERKKVIEKRAKMQKKKKP